MKSYKKLSFVLFLILSLSFFNIFFTSCNKYEEGPSFSLLSATKRITGTWDLKETLLNDEVLDVNEMLGMFGDIDMDSVSGFEIDLSQVTLNSVKITFEKEGSGNFTFSISYMGFPISQAEDMTWSFDDDKENVNITFEEEAETFKILMLTKKEMWLENTSTEDGITTVIVMKFDKQDD